MNSRVICLALAIVALALCCILGSCSKKGGTDVDDGNNPYVIMDLRVTATTDSSISLAWTATGDDADQGTCAGYDMRICTDPINGSNWAVIGQLTGEPTPSAAGKTDSMTVIGLKKDSLYFFALNACDEAGNWSGLSNCASALCLDNFVVTFPDPHLEAAMRSALGIVTGPIRRLDVEPMTFLEANSDTIADLTGLEYCINLENVLLNSNPIKDLSPLGSLGRISEIQLVNDSLAAIPSLPGWTWVTRLFVTGNQITDISGIAGMTHLHHFYAANNQITDLSALIANNEFAVGDTAWLENNPLSAFAIGTQIPGIEARGAKVIH
ncbi:MAG: leucine-rich repeat domain-containing protein [Candidatus Zixiibacteriota bacterium]